MLELLDDIAGWQRNGREVALATLVQLTGSGPRDPGAAMAVTDRGELCGSISGGCVEAALVNEAATVLRDGAPRFVEYGLSGADGQAVGLTCGGRLRVFVEHLNAEVGIPAGRMKAENLIAVALRLTGAHAGSRLYVFPETVHGSLGNARLDATVIGEAHAQAAGETARVRTYGEAGEPHGSVEIFLQHAAPAPRMYIFGAIDFTGAVVHVAKFLGYHVTVCDARPAFAVRQRFPDADAVAVRWPDEFLKDAGTDERTALIVLTHDEKFDIPLLHAALESRAGYIGVMGSRQTHARRLEQLRRAGISEASLARLSAPIGLDIGARTPQETAVSICAELIARNNLRDGGRLTGGCGRIRGLA